MVFCRNVLIYFSAEVKRDILLRIHGTLKPGGYLFLGASEALNNLPDHYSAARASSTGPSSAADPRQVAPG